MQIILFLHFGFKARKQPQNRTDGTSLRFDRFYAILRGPDFNISDCQKNHVIYDNQMRREVFLVTR